ncbi:hypothetical protein [Methylobacterium isbiliense]|uniref:hypothetical protein n=1 Tax=Methylobacterium isbiliense TaxID=315478 RepID=UPI001EE096E1|nr:hypothetical protein [Methylobacterium isbiliense]MDN3624807.1 hypothetical protein [Methylobacterium isbiliense]
MAMREALDRDLALIIIGLSVAVWCFAIVIYAIVRSSTTRRQSLRAAHTSFGKTLAISSSIRKATLERTSVR